LNYHSAQREILLEHGLISGERDVFGEKIYVVIQRTNILIPFGRVCAMSEIKFEIIKKVGVLSRVLRP